MKEISITELIALYKGLSEDERNRCFFKAERIESNVVTTTKECTVQVKWECIAIAMGYKLKR
jgi:hypothetical protein